MSITTTTLFGRIIRIIHNAGDDVCRICSTWVLIWFALAARISTGRAAQIRQIRAPFHFRSKRNRFKINPTGQTRSNDSSTPPNRPITKHQKLVTSIIPSSPLSPISPITFVPLRIRCAGPFPVVTPFLRLFLFGFVVVMYIFLI